MNYLEQLSAYVGIPISLNNFINNLQEAQQNIYTKSQALVSEILKRIGLFTQYMIPIIARLVLLCIALFVLFILSCLYTGLFRLIYLPTAKHIAPVHLEFSHVDDAGTVIVLPGSRESVSLSPNFPAAEIDYEGLGLYLRAGQGYDITLVLDLPESDVNKKHGIFMIELYLSTVQEHETLKKVRKPLSENVELSENENEKPKPTIDYCAEPTNLYSQESQSDNSKKCEEQKIQQQQKEKEKEKEKERERENEVVHVARRSSMLRFKSNLIQYMQTLFYALPYIFNLIDESQSLTVFMFENFVDTKNDRPISKARVQLSKPIQVYSAQLRFDAHFTGLKWFMYWYPVLSSLVFIAIFFSIQLFSITLLYIAFLLAQQEKETAKDDFSNFNEGISHSDSFQSTSDLRDSNFMDERIGGRSDIQNIQSGSQTVPEDIDVLTNDENVG